MRHLGRKVAFRALRCVVPGVRAVEACSDHSFPRHTHDQFGIGIIRAGAQKSLSGRGMVEAGAGMTITVNPGEVHDGSPLGGGPRRWSMLYLETSAMDGLIAGLSDAGARFEFHAPVLDRPDIGPRFDKLFTAMTTEHDLMRSEELALALFGRLVPARARAPTLTTPDIGRALSLIDDMPARAVELAELAELCDASRFQTIRAFARTTGLTPHAYLVQKRVALARRLIDCGMPLAEAAVESGFFDQSHMTRHFSRILGISPGAYAAAR